MKPSSFQCHTVWSKRLENATFFLLSSHPRFYRSWSLSFVTSWNNVPENRKSSRHFHMFIFLGVHFTAFCVLEHVMNAVSVCIVETQSCVLYTFFIMSLNFHLSKKLCELFTSCICMQAWHFSNFQIRANLCSPCHYIFRAYTTKNLKETCYTSSLSECSLGICWMFNLCSSHHKQPQQVMDFSPSVLPFTCCGIIFVYLKMAWTQHNTLLIAENVTLPQLRDFRLRTLCEWDLHSFGILHSSVGEDSSHLGCFALHLQGQQSKMQAVSSAEMSVTLHQSTGCNLHHHLYENVISYRTENHAGLSYCVTRL